MARVVETHADDAGIAGLMKRANMLLASDL